MREENGQEKMLVRAKRIQLLGHVIVAVMTIVTGVVMRYLPEKIPMHFNGAGQINRFGSKYELWVIIAMILVGDLVYAGLIARRIDDVRRADDDRVRAGAATNCYVQSITGVGVIIVLGIAQLELLITGIKGVEELNPQNAGDTMAMWMNIALGLMMIILGDLMPKSRNNRIFGVRTSWSQYNDETWAISNRIGGRLTVAAGFVILLAGLICGQTVMIIVLFLGLGVMAVGSIWASYYAYTQVKAKENAQLGMIDDDVRRDVSDEERYR